MANPKGKKRCNKTGTGHRKARNSAAEDHHSSESEPAENPRSYRPKPVPNYKGTPAYDARQKTSQTANVDAEDFDAATALVAFQQYSHTSDTNKAPATHTNTIRVPPLRPKRIVLDPMDKVFARSMRMSEEEMIAQKRWALENGSDAGKDSGAEDDLPITKLAEKHNEKKKVTVTAGTKSDEAPMDVSASEDNESEPGV